MDYLGIFCCC